MKFYLLLPLLLLSLLRVSGQSDTSSPRQKDTVRDTNAIRTPAGAQNRDSQSATGLVPGDSERRDPIRPPKPARQNKPAATGMANRDSSGKITSGAALPGAAQAGLTQSGQVQPGVAQPASSQSGGIQRDSTHPGSNQASAAGISASSSPAPAPHWQGPDDLTIWNHVLANSPYFSFTGTPVAEKYEVHRPNSKDSLFYLLVGILFYFALIRLFFEKYFNNLMTLFFRVSLRQQQIREQVLQTPLPSLLLNILFILSTGLFASFLIRATPFGSSVNFWLLYADCMAGLAFIYLLKFLILKFCGWVFNISRATDTYIFIVFLVNKMLGIFLLPFLILIIFSGNGPREILVTISFTMIFVLFIYRIFASYRPIGNEIKLTPFHFFLYLCAFEIAPLLLIYKVLLSYLEKGY